MKQPKLPCPWCQHWYSDVTDSRGEYRTRECQQCGTRWVTIERFERFVADSAARTRRLPSRYQRQRAAHGDGDSPS